MEKYNKKFETTVMQLEEMKEKEINEEIVKAKAKEKNLEAEATADLSFANIISTLENYKPEQMVAAVADTISFTNIIQTLEDAEEGEDNRRELVYNKKLSYKGQNYYNFHITQTDENTISYSYGFSMLKHDDVNETIERISGSPVKYKLTKGNEPTEYTLTDDAAKKKLNLIEGLTKAAYDKLLNEL